MAAIFAPGEMPFELWGAGPEPLLFCHANGYPPACYQPLMENLAQPGRRIMAPHLRSLWPNADPLAIANWRTFSDDLASFLDTHASESITAVGHSVGGIQILRLAIAQPERFKAVILLDPVLFPLWMILFWNVIYSLGIAYRVHPLTAAAGRRRSVFASREMVFESYRRKPVFRYLDDAALRQMIEGMFVEASLGGECRLAQPTAWEQRIYVTGLRKDYELWQGLRTLGLPVLIVRGAETDTFWVETAQRVRQVRPRTRIETVKKATHLVPLERPGETAGLIEDFLKEPV
jgi:pimeloyl-ACP methyl ester carboxylesterase